MNQMNPRIARLLAGKTQSAIAEYLGISRWTYSKWEKKPDLFTVEQAKRFSSLVGIPVGEIFSIRESN